jgi:hypothetical protein
MKKKDPSITRVETKHSIVYKCHDVSFLYIYKLGAIFLTPGLEVEGGPTVILASGDRNWIHSMGYIIQSKSRWE